MVRRAPLALLLLLIPVVPAGFALPPAPVRETPVLEEWYRGPVRYLISRREEKRYRSLDDDTARILFIRDFWKARDPYPDTPENEARLAFWERVAEATDLFRYDSAIPGWLTDRGRIHILLGPPNDIEKDLNFIGETDEGQFRGLLRWIYHGKMATGRSEPTFVVAFIADPASEWRLTDDAQLSSVFFDPLRAKAQRDNRPLLTRIQSALVTGPSDLGVALDLARVTTPAVDSETLIDTVITQEFYGTLPVTVRWDAFPGPGDGTSMAVVTAFIPRSALAASRTGLDQGAFLVGRMEHSSGRRIDLGEGSFAASPLNRDAGPDDILKFQVKRLVEPGTYETSVGVFDPMTFYSATDRRTVEIPAFDSGELSITPVVPVHVLQRVQRPADRGFTLPFVLGELRVIPRERPVFPRSEGLAFYFHLVFPPGEPPARMEMRFFRRDDGGLLPVGRPQVIPAPEPVQGWQFPVEPWPPGNYRLRIDAVPAGGGEASIRTFDFAITDGS